jgi:hypothetical protein
MYRNPFEREKRKFKNLASRVNQLLISKEWENLSAHTRTYLIGKLNSLYSKLSRFFPSAELRKILAAAALLIAFPLVSKSQSFDPPRQNPFGFNPPETYFVSPAFADLDNDNDLDLLTGSYEGNIYYYENTGTIYSPQYAVGQLNPFGLMQNGELSFVTSGDIDNDGDIDLFIGGYDGKIWFQENTGTASNPAFAPSVQNPFGLTSASEFAIPSLVDIDDDGDLDLFVGEYPGNVKFYENTGSVTSPHFALPQQNPFGITQAYLLGVPSFADLDHDGDFDLFEGEYYGNIRYFKNTGTASSPNFAPPITNPFGLVPVNTYAFPAFADIDNDGDLDLFIGEYYGNLQYFENTEINIGINRPETGGDFSFYPNPANEEIFLKISGQNQALPFMFQIFNITGKIMKSGEIDTQNMRINTSDLSAGIYTVQLIGRDKVHTVKIVIE